MRAREALAVPGLAATTAAEATAAAAALRAILAQPRLERKAVPDARRLSNELEEFGRFIDGMVADCGLETESESQLELGRLSGRTLRAGFRVQHERMGCDGSGPA